jgi:hypothetical protein
MVKPHSDLNEQEELLDRAVWLKWNKYTWSGLLILGIGCLLIVVGSLLNSGAYSAEGLLLGLGAIVIVIGLVRIFIGFINPLTSSDIHHSRRLPPLDSSLNQDERIFRALEDEGSD